MGRPSLALFVVATVLLLDLTTALSVHSGQCPPKYKVYNNKPTCFSDADCQKYGKICCPNQYNTKSCTDRAPYLKQYFKEKNSGLAAGNSRIGAGVYCDGVKCLPWEVCKPDPFTKKLKCQHA